MFVKVCGITNLEDALQAVEAGADALGFNFYPGSPRYISTEEARRIISALPPQVLSVGVFVNEAEPARVADITDEAGLKAVQLHGDESPAYCKALRGRFLIKALRVTEGFDPQTVREYEADAILLDAYAKGARGGTGHTFDWAVARRTREFVPRLFLAGGLSVENVAAAVAAVEPYGVDACSLLEHAPGRKDAERVRAFIKAAHVKP
jgi:phosphoribosylanthranilate isomerase